MAVQEHFERLQALIDLEREAEKAENLRELRKFPVAQREARGKTVSALIVDGVEGGMGGMTMITLSRAPRSGEELTPFHAMNAGDNVLLTFSPGNLPGSVEGTLYKVDDHRVTVALNSAGPEEEIRGHCQIDLLGSDATYQRMRKALVTVAESKRSRVSTLREIFLGEQEPERVKVPKVIWLNRNLNEYQQTAVKNALASQDVALVHGPPGTGKTTVLVEIIRQHVARGERVLATAPSNIAVDNILEKLIGTGLRVTRLGHPARTLEALRHGNLAAQIEEDPAYEEVKELDAYRERLIHRKSRHGRGIQQLGYEERQLREREVGKLWRQARDLESDIARSIVAGANVVLATHAGMSKRYVKGDFDLVVLDEASQASEPLSWVPLTIARKAIFAGDANQLPPTIYSKEAAEGGLTVTLFDRLKKILPASAQTLLRVQYRMHEDIMRFPSKEFYEGKLIADESVAKHVASELAGVAPSDLTSRPVTFVDTAGAGFDEVWNEMLESRENKGEAELAVKLLYELLGSGIKPKDVAILTPYTAQAKLLKTLVHETGLEIGSVDGFQGREKEAIILSLVRSSEAGQIGFLSDMRRLNVAITRARRCLIVVGDSATIGRHPVYARFVAHADALDSHRSSYEWISA
ncbi:MAG: AAA family ATPase [Elusimicrobia bacterium]|nr:AAA family ATPase [Elusimicrobiota bacterium]